MKTVAKNLWTKSYIIKNSKFEIFITQVNNENEITEFLKYYQDLKATHNCYAYIFDFKKQIKRFNDDGEPSKSAGSAILKILEEEQLINIIVLVRRYFQPPKLGVGQLIRAYQEGLLKYLKEVKLLAVIPSKEYLVIVSSSLINLFYQWQKQYHFLILKQTMTAFTVEYIINIAKENDVLPYNSDIKVSFIRNSFLISDN